MFHVQTVSGPIAPDALGHSQIHEHIFVHRTPMAEKNPALRLDVGAIAKGYAVEQVCRAAPDGLLLSVGGNVRATGPKPGGENWVVGIQAPDGESGAFLHTLYVRDVSVVTSGDYQNYYQDMYKNK